MKFCKKCHKVVIDGISKMEELRVRCRCDPCIKIVGKDGKRMLRDVISNSSCKWTAMKRRAAKDITESVRYHASE